MSELKAAGSEYISDRYFAFIATALGRLSRFDEALRIVDESFEFIERTGQQYYAAELRRLKGELMLAQSASNASQAEQSFRDAIEIARKQHAKSWELRAIDQSRAHAGESKAIATTRDRCSPKFTTGSPRASTLRI